jgi:hypothetical protein
LSLSKELPVHNSIQDIAQCTFGLVALDESHFDPLARLNV